MPKAHSIFLMELLTCSTHSQSTMRVPAALSLPQRALALQLQENVVAMCIQASWFHRYEGRLLSIDKTANQCARRRRYPSATVP
jgi:hypothetical protein